MPDVVVVGGGVAGAAFAFHAARAGKRVLVLEAEPEVGGSMASAREPDGFWFELGAHTLYNSYGATLELIEAVGLLDELQPRGKPVLRFLDADGGNGVGPGKNLGALMRRFSKLELLAAIPRWIGADSSGKTVAEHYGRLVGRGNYARVLGPMVSAVPSQRADELPAEMLFKRRERRQDVMRSFTFPGGVRTLVERLLASEGVEVRTGARATALTATAGARGGVAVTLDDGSTLEAATCALCAPPSVSAALLAGVERLSPAAAAAGRVGEARIESLGVSVPKDAVSLDYATFLIPRDPADALRSVVTRDVVPHPERRGFTFHFESGLDRAAQRARAAAVLGVGESDLSAARTRTGVLPSPRRGHAELVADLDAALAGTPIAVSGNWFGGLSIEDCTLRSRAEWGRLRESQDLVASRD